MADWTNHHFTGGQDDEGRFKGKGELQIKEVGKTITRKVNVMFIKIKMKVKVII